MGCEYYGVSAPRETEVLVHFSEAQEDIGCLCTFPHNDDGEMDVQRVRSLAYLGAAVALLNHGLWNGGEYFAIPQAIPQWIRDEIDKRLGIHK